MYQLLFPSFPLSSFLIFKGEKKLSLWITRANGDATKENLFHTLEPDYWHIWAVEWISANRIALGLDLRGLGNGIEIWEIDEEGETANRRFIEQMEDTEYVSLKI